MSIDGKIKRGQSVKILEVQTVVSKSPYKHKVQYKYFFIEIVHLFMVLFIILSKWCIRNTCVQPTPTLLYITIALAFTSVSNASPHGKT